MMTLIAALVLVSPSGDAGILSPIGYIPDRRDLEHCTGQIVCPFTSSGRVCVCEGPVISLGSWGQFVAEGEHASLSAPAAFGAYATEQKSVKTEIYISSPY